MRSLTPEESELWDRVAATIRPLSRDSNDPHTIPAGASSPTKPVRPRPSFPPAASPQRAALGATLDASWDRRLRNGSVEPDRVVDLHGMSLDRAWQAIDRALDQAISRGERVVLLITGHERSGEQPVRRGAIRAAVHDWLHASRHARNIASVRGAHVRHGGGGSLYIVLRRKREPR